MIEQVNKDIAEALKSGDKKRADALKMLKNSFKMPKKPRILKLIKTRLTKLFVKR